MLADTPVETSAETPAASSVSLAAYFGDDLTTADLASLSARWITPDLARAALLRRVDSSTGQQLVGGRRGDYSGIAIPYHSPDGRRREYRLRRDHPEMEATAGGFKPRAKYVSPPGARNMIYFPPGITTEILNNSGLPVVVTEGEFKTIALWHLANHETAEPRFLPIGLSGVWNWRGTVGKKTASDGRSVPLKGPIPDLDLIAWKDRRVIVAFDADASRKEPVKIARTCLSKELRCRGSLLAVLEWPEADGKGVDDLLANVGPDRVLGLLDALEFGEETGWKALLKKQRGKPKGNLLNAITTLNNAPEWAGVLSFDEFSHRVTCLSPPPWIGQAEQQQNEQWQPKQWGDIDDIQTASWLQEQGIDVGQETAGQAVQAVADKHRVHPVREFLNGLHWDGTPRLDAWLVEYLGVQPSEYAAAVGARFLLSAVARVFQPGCKADSCLILEGPQNIGKSLALRRLAEPWFTDTLPPLDTKDAAQQLVGVWIVEWAELDSMGRHEATTVKAFLSRETDRYRPAYGRRVVDVPRQCVFAGSTNADTWQRDETGGRRFWPVRCGRIDLVRLAEDRDQLWAEAVDRYREGAVWWLDREDLRQEAAEEIASRYETDAWQQLIDGWLVGRIDTDMTEILGKCLDKPVGQWTQADKNRVARCLKAIGWERFRQRAGNRLEWRYRRKE